jgi:hypothetical protein
MGIFFNFHEVADDDGPRLANAADIIPPEIDQHNMFGALFFILSQFLLKPGVFSGVFAARPCARQRTSDNDAVFDPDKDFR